MASVTIIVKETKQPRGGFIRPSSLVKTPISDNQVLAENENIPAATVGMAVDYMTRFMAGSPLEEAFKVSFVGALYAQKFGPSDAMEEFLSHLKSIHGLDNDSIIHACHCVSFDAWMRNTAWAISNYQMNPNLKQDISPDETTIQNIRILIERSLHFFESYGPVTKDGFSFAPNGYTEIVTAGDGDFLTSDTLWDFKVSKRPPTSQNTLQLLMYYIMEWRRNISPDQTLKELISLLKKTPGQSDKIMVADISTNPYRPWTPADENDESIKYLYAYDEDKGTTVLYNAFFDVFAATSDFQCRNEKQ